MSRTFHSSQKRMFSCCRVWYDSDEMRAVAVAPPGFGKTSVITGLFDHAASVFTVAKEYKKASMAGAGLLLTPRLILNKQQSNEIQQMAIEGLPNVKKEVATYDCENGLGTERIKDFIANCKKRGNYPIIVSTYKSADKLSGFRFDLIICDEGHNVTAPGIFQAVMYKLDQKAKRLFVTATPKLNRHISHSSGSRGMGNSELYGRFIYAMSFYRAIDLGFILPIKRIKIDAIGASDTKGDHIVDLVIRSQLALKQGMGETNLANKVIYVFNNKAEIEVIRDNWQEIYYATGAKVFTAFSENESFHVNGEKPRNISQTSKIREDFITALRNEPGDCLLAHIDTMGEGVDVTGITGCVLINSGDETRIIQNIGRAMRILPEDRNKPKKERIKQYALLGIVSYNGETDAQSYIDGIARAIQAMSSRDFYKTYFSSTFIDRGDGSAPPDENGEPKNNMIGNQDDLIGFTADEQNDGNIFIDDETGGEEWIERKQKVIDLEEERRKEEEFLRSQEKEKEALGTHNAGFDAMMKMFGGA